MSCRRRSLWHCVSVKAAPFLFVDSNLPVAAELLPVVMAAVSMVVEAETPAGRGVV